MTQSDFDITWCIEKLTEYRGGLTEYITAGNDPHADTTEALEWLRRHESQIAQIAATTFSGTRIPSIQWRTAYDQVQIIERVIGYLETLEETQEHLCREPTIDINTEELHPWVWDAAKSLWNDGHYGQAMQAAATSVNLRTQAKTNRIDISNTDLMKQSLTLEDPTETSPVRLRVQPPDESETYRSRQQGAMHLAAGVFMLLRNTEAHQLGGTPREVAIEALAAISLLARVLDDAQIEQYGSDEETR